MSLPTYEDVGLPLLFEIHQLGGQANPQDIYTRVTAHFPSITDDDLSGKLKSGGNRWTNAIGWARKMLVDDGQIDNSTRGVWKNTAKGKSRLANSNVPKPLAYPFVFRNGRVVRIGSSVTTPGSLPPTPSSPPPVATLQGTEKTHDRLKRLMIDMGNKLGYCTETEQGPQYRHDVLWRQGPYKTPCIVIEICDGGSLPKDFDSLHWAIDPGNWGAKGILVVTDDKDFDKATRRFAGKTDLVAVKTETVDALYKIVNENNQFLRLIFGQ